MPPAIWSGTAWPSAGALAAGDLVEARRRVAAIVGRDTETLDEAGVVRAAVESVAESTVDGVTAPLFWAIVAGPVGAMVYRAINTLDSMFGHQDDRYGQFGWAAARIDDLANYIPARLTAPLLCLAAMLLRQRPLQAARILLPRRAKARQPQRRAGRGRRGRRPGRATRRTAISMAASPSTSRPSATRWRRWRRGTSARPTP